VFALAAIQRFIRGGGAPRRTGLRRGEKTRLATIALSNNNVSTEGLP